MAIAVLRPPKVFEAPPECRETPLNLQIILREGNQHADPAHSVSLLRPPRNRAGRRAAEQRDELAASHSITSSAVASSLSGIERPSAFAVLRLIRRSNFVGCSTGNSAGLAPLKILST